LERKGVSYDVGRVMAGNWRPDFDLKVVQRELEIVRDDLHCNAVRICGRDIDRLVMAAGMALRLGLEVWLSPELWDKSQAETLAYITKAAMAAEALRAQWPKRLVLLVGAELTLSYADDRHGMTYPDLSWEPKKSFKAVADYYAR